MKYLLLLLLPVTGLSQAKLENISLADDKVEILAPKQLFPMSDQLWTTKYGTAKRPVLVLTDENGEVNLLAEITGYPLEENQLSSYKDFRMQHLAKSRADLTFLENGLKTVGGKKVGYFKFLSQATDKKIFNYYFFTTLEGKVLSFTFNCPEDLRKTWEKTADEIMGSLKVKQ